MDKIKSLYLYLRYHLLFMLTGTIRSMVGVHFNENLKQIARLKGMYDGRRCFIIATGPSLRQEDVEKLKDEITFGLNTLFLLYDQTEWRPDYYVFTDSPYLSTILDHYTVDVESLGKKGVILNKSLKKIKKLDHSQKIKYLSMSPWNRLCDFKYFRYSPDMVKGAYAFGTVTTVTMAIAQYMGFKEIYLLGADCSNMNQHFANNVTDQEKTNDDAAKNASAQLKGYRIMKKILDKQKVAVYNSTRGGELEVFPRKSLEQVLSEDNRQEEL